MTGSTRTRELLTGLVSAFGDAGRIAALLAPDAQWWISPSVPVLQSPTVGRSAIHEAERVIFEELYRDVRTEIHHTLVDEQTGMGAARFTMFATALFVDGEPRPYENEYCVWIRAEGAAITRVWEYVDARWAREQFEVKS